MEAGGAQMGNNIGTTGLTGSPQVREMKLKVAEANGQPGGPTQAKRQELATEILGWNNKDTQDMMGWLKTTGEKNPKNKALYNYVAQQQQQQGAHFFAFNPVDPVASRRFS